MKEVTTEEAEVKEDITTEEEEAEEVEIIIRIRIRKETMYKSFLNLQGGFKFSADDFPELK